MIRGMDKEIFKAAQDGNIGLLMTRGPLHLIRSATGQSVLHVHARSKTTNLEFMGNIIDREPSLLQERDDSDEIPLHIAARSGQHGAVKLFLEKGGTSLLGTINKSGDTALHIACRESSPRVVEELLCGNSIEDQYYVNTANNKSETPLFLALEEKNLEIIDLLVDKIPHLLYGNPLAGCALHTAVQSSDSGLVDKLMQLKPGLVTFQNERGETPLHYAAKYSYKCLETLLMLRSPAVYWQDTDGRTAAHIAVENNNVDGLRLLVDLHPDCCDLPDKKGRNVVHYAASLGRGEVLKYLLEDRHFNHLIYRGDDDENTPFHLFAINILTFRQASGKVMIRDVIPLIKLLMKPVFNKQNRTPGDIAAQYDISQQDLPHQDLLRRFLAVAPRSSRNRNLQEPVFWESTKAEEHRERVASKVKKVADKFVLVSILFAGASYQAGISGPGGFNQNDTDPVNGGTSMLASKPSFQAFNVFNIISFIGSIIATLLYSLVSLGTGRGIWKAVFAFAFLVTSISLATFVMSFIASVYATTWKSGISMLILYLTFWCFLLCYGLYVGGLILFMRERSKLMHSIV